MLYLYTKWRHVPILAQRVYMPRLLPRLMKEIEKDSVQVQNFPFRRKNLRKSLYKPPLPSPSFHPSHYERSILLASQSPVVHANAFVKHKRMPPIMTRPPQSMREAADAVRQMTDKEFSWSSNPYLRMLASPMRTCVVTSRTLPTDLLIRLVGMRLPATDDDVQSKRNSPPEITLVPDGLLHTKYVSRKVGGTAAYVLCWRKVVERLHPGCHRRISGKLVLPPSLPEYIAHLLRLRVLQELELLTDRLEYSMRTGKNLGIPAVILRRLSYDEWGTVRSTGTIPYPNAVAVLVLPQPNRHPVTKERPVPSMSASPPDDEERPEALPPLSELIPNADIPFHDETGTLPHLKIPLYNSITAFPSRSQRAALYQFLTRILAAERFLKRLHFKKHSDRSDIPDSANGEIRKGSPAFVLCSDNRTIRRGDSAAVALALWRLRMYEGDGWRPSST